MPWALSDAFSALWRPIIRPERDAYTLDELGPTEFDLGGRISVERKDFQLKNPRGMRLECSRFIPISGVHNVGWEPEIQPCVVYVHSSLGSRMEACSEYLLGALLARGISVLTFDSSGSGMSDGEYISVGHYEQLDLKVVLEHLRKSENLSHIGLWGRSMGAVAATFRLRRDLQIAAAVLDSPFTNLRVVGEELATSGEHIQIPKYLFSRVYDHIASEIQSRVGVDVSKIAPIDDAPHIECPTLFAAAESDTVVFNHHTTKMYNAWGCDLESKKIFKFPGDHWNQRPWWFCEEAADFLELHLVLKPMQQRRKKEMAKRQMLARQRELELQAEAAEKARLDEEKARLEEEKRRRMRAEAKARAQRLSIRRKTKEMKEAEDKQRAESIAAAKAMAEADAVAKAESLSRHWEIASAKIKRESQEAEDRELLAMYLADKESRGFAMAQAAQEEAANHVKLAQQAAEVEAKTKRRINILDVGSCRCCRSSREHEDSKAEAPAHHEGDVPISWREAGLDMQRKLKGKGRLEFAMLAEL